MTVSPAVLISFCVLVLGFAGAVATWAIRVSKGESALDAAKRAHERADEAHKELAAYKVHVAETYVSHTALSEVERRIMESINALGNRLERLFHPTPPGA